ADGETLVIGGTTYEFDSDAAVTPGNTAVTIAADVASTIAAVVAAVGDARVTASGTDTLSVVQSGAGTALAVDPSGAAAIAQSATGAFAVPALTAATPAVAFNGDGSPSAFNVANITVADWQTGAADSAISLDLGTEDLPDGITQFSGQY